MQAGVLALLFCFLLVRPAHGDKPGTSAVNALPANGKARGVVLKSQTVDTVISEDGDTVWADTRVWLRLHNPATKPITVPLTLPGPQPYPSGLPPDLQVRLDNIPLTLTVTAPASAADGPLASADVRLPPRSSVNLRLTYRQALPEHAGLTVFAYMLSAVDQWASTPESLRVTVEFKSPISPSQLLAVAPSAHRTDTRTLTWDWERDWAKTKPSVGLAFMSPGWWAEYNAARAAARAPGATAAAHIALSKHYQQLAALPQVPFEGEEAYYDRYYPSAVGELQAAITSSSSSAETITARTMLADLYRQRADRLGAGKDDTYLQLATAEIEAALESGEPDPVLRALATDIYTRLGERAGANGDDVGAERYRSRLAALQTPHGVITPEQRQRSEGLAAAVEAAEQHDLEKARQVLTDTFGPEAAGARDARAPRVKQSVVTITTGTAQRIVVLALQDSRDPKSIPIILQETADALNACAPGAAITGTDRLTLTLPFKNGEDLVALQARLGERLPDIPELALLSSVLTGDKILQETDENLFRSVQRYVEQVNLGTAAQTWQRLADRLDEASRQSLAELEDATETDRLHQVQRALWSADASAWRDLAAHSRAEYRIELDNPGVAREWQIPAGGSRQLELEISRWNLEHLRWVAIGAAVTVLGLALILWRVT